MKMCLCNQIPHPCESNFNRCPVFGVFHEFFVPGGCTARASTGSDCQVVKWACMDIRAELACDFCDGDDECKVGAIACKTKETLERIQGLARQAVSGKTAR